MVTTFFSKTPSNQPVLHLQRNVLNKALMVCFPQNFSRLSYHPCFLSFSFLYHYLYPFFLNQDTEQTLSSVDEDRKMYLQVSRCPWFIYFVCVDPGSFHPKTLNGKSSLTFLFLRFGLFVDLFVFKFIDCVGCHCENYEIQESTEAQFPHTRGKTTELLVSNVSVIYFT